MGFNEIYREAKEMRAWCRDDDCANDFFLRYQKTILMLANKAIRMGARESLEDLVQNGVLGLLMAKERYKSFYTSDKRKVQFSTYAYQWIKALMLGKKNPADSDLSLDEPLEGEDGAEGTLYDLIAAQEPRIDRLMEEREFWQIVDVLPDKQRAVILSRYKEDMTLAAIGEQMGYTREYIRKIEAKALMNLRKYLAPKRKEADHGNSSISTGWQPVDN